MAKFSTHFSMRLSFNQNSHFYKNGTLKGTTEIGSSAIVALERAGNNIIAASTSPFLWLDLFWGFARLASESILILTGTASTISATCESVAIPFAFLISSALLSGFFDCLRQSGI